MIDATPEPTSAYAFPRAWAQAVVVEEVYCRKCGYDLRGLSVDGRCPECGLDVWATVVHTVDPAASRLPSLRNPTAVGNGLLCQTVSMLMGAAIMVAPSVIDMLSRWDVIAPRRLDDDLAKLSWVIASVVAALGLWAVWLLAPPRDREHQGAVWRDIWRIGLGFIGWIVFGTMWASEPAVSTEQSARQHIALHFAAAVFAGIGLIGLRGVFGVIGMRSREYRRSRGGRQSLELLIVAIAAGLLSNAVNYLTWLEWFPGQYRADVRTYSTIALWISHFMAVIGLAYLVVNAWWIRRALRRPPPPLEQILLPAPPPTPAVVPPRLTGEE